MGYPTNQDLLKEISDNLKQIAELCEQGLALGKAAYRTEVESTLREKLIHIRNRAERADVNLIIMQPEVPSKLPVGELDSETKQVTLPADLPTTA